MLSQSLGVLPQITPHTAPPRLTKLLQVLGLVDDVFGIPFDAAGRVQVHVVGDHLPSINGKQRHSTGTDRRVMAPPAPPSQTRQGLPTWRWCPPGTD